ncbi:MAG: hypothetical protein K0S55_759 [Clostridia bacterium]|nr:hypothetical protein [Clostridia bacterium]
MLNIILGLFFILFSYKFPFYSETIKDFVNVDILPDFIGYLLIWFGLEKATALNRWFKDASSLVVGLMVLTFISFFSQISFFFKDFLDTDGQIYAIILSLVKILMENGEAIVQAICMFFLGMYSTGIGHEMGNIKNSFLGSIAYGFSVIYALLIIVFIIRQFITFPFDMWIVTAPINLVFILYNTIALNKIKELK